MLRGGSNGGAREFPNLYPLNLQKKKKRDCTVFYIFLMSLTCYFFKYQTCQLLGETGI